MLVSEGGYVFPIGTAFLISRFGYVLSAAHSIFEGIRREPKLAHLRNDKRLGGRFDLTKIGFGALVHYPTSDGFRVHFLSLENVGAPPPTDVVIGSIANFHDPDPESPLVLSPGLLGGGSSISAVGYHRIIPKGGLKLEDVQSDPDGFLKQYNHRIRVSRGSIKVIFAGRFSSGYGNFPCFLTDLDVIPGQSGGPVIGPSDVCGIVTGSASSFATNAQASLASMLYRLLGTNVTKSLRLAKNFQMNFGTPFLRLLQNGFAKSDGSKSHVIMCPTGGGRFYISHVAEPKNETFVFDDFAAFQASRKAFTKPIEPPNSD